MSAIYCAAQTPNSARILGSVAFVHLSAGYECTSGAIPKSGGPPTGSVADAKFKIVGFHVLGMSSNYIKMITYDQKSKKE